MTATATLTLPRATVEQAVGRRLSQAEAAVDVALLDRALTQAKNDVDEAIAAEMLRATTMWVQLGTAKPTLYVTEPMLTPLDELRDLGRAEAWNELDRLGYPILGRRQFAVAPRPDGPDDLADYLRRSLLAVSIRIADDIDPVDLTGATQAAIARALRRVPGGRDIASRIVSTALYGGMGETWASVEDIVDEWEITAVLDQATCDPCAHHDGETFPTLAEAYELLPNGGPAVYCLGSGRCRCRLLPAARA